MSTVTGQFTDTGTSDDIGGKGDFHVCVQGFGTATVLLEANTGNDWYTVETYTANTHKVVSSGADAVRYRLRCSVFVLGPIDYTIGR